MLVLADECAQLVIFVLDHGDGVLQWTDLYLEQKTHIMYIIGITLYLSLSTVGLNDSLHLRFNRDMIERDFLTATFAIKKRGLKIVHFAHVSSVACL